MSRLLMWTGIVVLFGVAVAGCDSRHVAIDGTITGSGHSMTSTRQAEGVTSVELRGSGIVHIVQGTRESLQVTAEDNILPLIDTPVEGGKLTLGFSTPSRQVHPTQPIIFSVSLKNVQDIELSGAGDIDASDVHTSDLQIGIGGAGHMTLDRLTSRSLRVQLSGNGALRASGQVTTQQITITGAGAYQAQGLTSQDADVSVPGAGTAVVLVRDHLHAEIGGTGSIRYLGDPIVDQKITGAGTITRQSDS